MLLLRNRRLQLLVAFVALIAVSLLVSSALSQRRSSGGGRFAEMERRSLAQPFVGITSNGELQSDLFSIEATGVSTKPVADAAIAFLASLNEEQRNRVMFPVNDPEWRRWANQHSFRRQGVSFEELDERQREAGFSLMQAGLSARGFKQSRDIMRLNYSLGEITSNFEELDEWFYYLTVMGEPSAESPWGWQLDGHHLIINFFLLGDQVVMTPTFMGSEPVIAEAGKYKGVAVMQEELRRGLKMVQSLTPTQLKKAVIESSKVGNNAVAEAFKDNLDLDFAGIAASELNGDQRELLLDVVDGFVGHMSDGHAKIRMDEVRARLDRTYFAWIGGIEDDDVFYYRVHSPVVLVEFDHQRPVFMRLPRVPQRQHVHAVIRTPNGNDYGKDLLRQHYETSHRAQFD